MGSCLTSVRDGERSCLPLGPGEWEAVLPSGAVSPPGMPPLDEDRPDVAGEGVFFLEGATGGSCSGEWGDSEHDGSLGRIKVSRLLFRAWPLLRSYVEPR